MVPVQKLAFEHEIKVKFEPQSGRVMLRNASNYVVLAIGCEVAIVNGKPVRLKESPRMGREGLLVPAEVASFFAKPQKKLPMRGMKKFVVVLDAGHGGRFTGAIANGLVEKHLNLDVVRRVAKILRKEKNIKVVLTRRDDEELDDNWSRDLDARVDVANHMGADLFVSVHFNAAAGRRQNVSGIEIFIAREEEDVDRRVGRALREAAAVITRLGKLAESPYSNTAWILHRILLENKYRRSLKAAHCFVRVFKKNREDFVRGIFSRGFRVIKWTRCPAVLLELGYLTNPETATRLKTVRYRRKLAEMVAQGIKDYITLMRQEEEQQKSQHKLPQTPSTK